MKVRTLRSWAAIALLFMAIPAHADPGNAQAVVEHLHATLVKGMQEGDALGFNERVALLEPVIADSFNFNTIARIVTGRYWKDASEAQRSAFIDAFRQLSTATYASNFSSFSGERFELAAVEENAGTVVVKTDLVKGDGGKVSLNYLLHGDNGRWRIVNVIAQGVSDLSLKRADYTAVIKSEGFDSLVDRLKKRVAEMGRSS